MSGSYIANLFRLAGTHAHGPDNVDLHGHFGGVVHVVTNEAVLSISILLS